MPKNVRGTSQTRTRRYSVITNEQNKAQFVALIECYPWIYDTTHPDYAIAEKVDAGWQQVVDELGIGATIQDCKARWRNIRGRFTKYIKAFSEDSTVTPYYLASALRSNRSERNPAMFPDNSHLFTPSITLGEVEIIESSDEGELDLKPTCIEEESLLVEPISEARPTASEATIASADGDTSTGEERVAKAISNGSRTGAGVQLISGDVLESKR
ncbi:hypothetical protein quinque_014520 [Culex quinquefasciatus]